MLFWFRAVFATMMRELKIFFRYPTAFVSLFVWPLLFPFSIIFMSEGLAGTNNQGLEQFSHLTSTDDYFSFLIIGTLAFLYIRNNIHSGGQVMQTDRVRGTLDTHWTLPVNTYPLIIGPTIASLILYIFPLVISVSVYSAVGYLQINGDLIDIFLTLILVLPFLYGFMFLLSAITMRARETDIVFEVIEGLISSLCGFQFALAVFPESIQKISWMIPLTHYAEILRGVLLHGNQLAQYKDSIIYIVVCGIVLFGTGILFFELTKRSLRKNSLVSGY